MFLQVWQQKGNNVRFSEIGVWGKNLEVKVIPATESQ
jgi:hypothetical protein